MNTNETKTNQNHQNVINAFLGQNFGKALAVVAIFVVILCFFLFGQGGEKNVDTTERDFNSEIASSQSEYDASAEAVKQALLTRCQKWNALSKIKGEAALNGAKMDESDDPNTKIADWQRGATTDCTKVDYAPLVPTGF